MSENLSQKAYWHIHGKLSTGTLKPGLRLSNRAVAKEVGMSFTPVREAFNRLVSEGLLEYREGLGVFVPISSRKEIEELYEVREIIECEVVARVSGNLPARTLQEMRDLQKQMHEIVETARRAGHIGGHAERLRELDSTFHLTLIQGTGNRQLLDTVTNLRKKCAIKTGDTAPKAGLVAHVFQTEPFECVERAYEEHEELLELLANGDGEAAARLMAKHIGAGRRLAMEAHDRAYMRSPRRAAYSATKETSF